jgi:Uncharacterized protein conserved in bacteria
MKLVIAIISGDDTSKVTRALTKGNFTVTKLATTGGFLMLGNTTLMIGTEEENVPQLLEILAKNCKAREQLVPASASHGVNLFSAPPIKVQVGGATVFVLDVEQFIKL